MKHNRPRNAMRAGLLVASVMLSFAVIGGTSRCAYADEPFMGAYLHLPALYAADDDVPRRRQQMKEHLARFKASGLRVVMPYVTTTIGTALYPSEIVPTQENLDWDPVGEFIDEARDAGLQIYPVVCVLACGKKEPTGILQEYPEWALHDGAGRPIGHISPCHPDARAWIVSALQEIVAKYNPDGVLLDYLRFNNGPVQLDTHGAGEFQEQKVAAGTKQPLSLQHYKEKCLTKLMRSISEELRQQQPGIKLAIYSWGPHVTRNHPVAQDWPTWADKGYIDMVSISGYCFPKNYGNRYMQVFAERIGGALAINRGLPRPIDVTLCLGIKTSHGEIDKAADVERYLTRAEQLGVNGVGVFTWSHMHPYLNEIVQQGYFEAFQDRIKSRSGQPAKATTNSALPQR